MTEETVQIVAAAVAAAVAGYFIARARALLAAGAAFVAGFLLVQPFHCQIDGPFACPSPLGMHFSDSYFPLLGLAGGAAASVVVAALTVVASRRHRGVAHLRRT